MRRAMARQEADRRRREESFRRRQEQVYARVPRLREIDGELTRLLADLDLPADYLEYKPACPLCNDVGTRGEAVCACLRRYYAQEQQAELSRSLDLSGQSFDTFSLDWYDRLPDTHFGMSPRENMETVYEVCANYAHAFGRRS